MKKGDRYQLKRSGGWHDPNDIGKVATITSAQDGFVGYRFDDETKRLGVCPMEGFSKDWDLVKGDNSK